MKRLSKSAVALISIAVSLGLLVFLISRVDLARVRVLVSRADAGWLLLAVLFACLQPPCATLRWLGVLKAQKNLRFPFSRTLRAVLMAYVLNSFTPSKGGDLVKAAYLRRDLGLSAGIGTVVLERLVDLGVLGVMGVIASRIAGSHWSFIAGLLLVAAVVVGFLMIAATPAAWLERLPGRIGAKLRDGQVVFHAWCRRPGPMALTIGASAVHWALGGLVVCALVASLAHKLDFAFTFSIFPVAILAGLVPLTMGGYGTRDAAFVHLLGARIALDEATLAALGYTALVYWLLSLLSLPVVYQDLREFLRSRDESARSSQAGPPGSGSKHFEQ